MHGFGGHAHQQILEAPLPRGLDEELRDLWRDLGATSPWGLAVRSSATCEDGLSDGWQQRNSRVSVSS